MLIKLGFVLLVFAWCAHCEYTLTVLHTNDCHARIDQSNAYGSVCSEKDAEEEKCFGGVARRHTKIQEIRNTTENVILLDGGDQFQGTLWFYVYKGAEASYFMNKLGYDAMGIGNHEFDNGVDGLVPFLENVTFAVLSSNMDDTEEPSIQGKYEKREVFEIGGKKIGVIGYTTTDTPALSNPGNIKFSREVDAIQSEVDKLRADGVQMLIAVGHSGFAVDKEIAEKVDGLDLVVGGHTNTFLYTGDPPSNEVPDGTYPEVIVQQSGKQVLVVQDFYFGKYLGYLEVTFDDDGNVLSYQGNPILLDKTVPEDPAMKAEVEIFKGPIDDMYTQKIGKTHVFLDGQSTSCRLEECNMGNLVADAMVHQHLKHADELYWTNASIAITNSGAIRDSISVGDITAGQVIDVQPFGNTVDLIDIRGKHIKEVMEHSVKGYDTEIKNGKFLQFSGFRVKYDLSKPDNSRVIDVQVRCNDCTIPKFVPLEDETVYQVVIPGFIVNGGDGYVMIKEYMLKHHVFGDVDMEILLEYIESLSPIIHGLEGRIVFDKEELPVACPTASGASGVISNIVLTVSAIALLRNLK